MLTRFIRFVYTPIGALTFDFFIFMLFFFEPYHSVLSLFCYLVLTWFICGTIRLILAPFLCFPRTPNLNTMSQEDFDRYAHSLLPTDDPVRDTVTDDLQHQRDGWNH